MSILKDIVVVIVVGIINLHFSILCANMLKRSGILKAKGMETYSTVERWIRVYTMITAIILSRWAFGEISFKLLDNYTFLHDFKKMQLKSTVLGATAFVRPLAGDVFSYFE